ncbi:hypothetical protein BDZ91DRAFT_373112 [Kalaharituber pfeilii]|nr:hypothetical protein BDZ91DRAFT_373112 [Kalaharituber pfeilii]
MASSDALLSTPETLETPEMTFNYQIQTWQAKPIPANEAEHLAHRAEAINLFNAMNEHGTTLEQHVKDLHEENETFSQQQQDLLRQHTVLQEQFNDLCMQLRRANKTVDRLTAEALAAPTSSSSSNKTAKVPDPARYGESREDLNKY